LYGRPIRSRSPRCAIASSSRRSTPNPRRADRRIAIKFYDFLDKAPKLDGLIVIEGTDAVLAQRALDAIIARALPAELQALNLDIIAAPETDHVGRAVADASTAMPFLAERRVIVVRNCHQLRAQPRRDVWAAAQQLPAGNTLVLEDLFAPNKKTKPEPFGALAGRKALRIDTTLGADARERFVRETLTRLGATAQPRVIAELAGGDADLGSLQNDLEKLALTGKSITYEMLEAESLSIEDPKAWHYAQALVEGRADEALAIAFELFASDPRGAAVPLASAIAGEMSLLWELARPGGGASVEPRHRWRVGKLQGVARRIGAARARRGYEAAVRGFEAVVTGRIDDGRAMIELLTADIASHVTNVRAS
jgi:DNA polymerase III delta subunit